MTLLPIGYALKIGCGPIVVLDIVDAGLALANIPHDHGHCPGGRENGGNDCDRLHDGDDQVKNKKCLKD